jgi:pimeloyl-ACP methyl ester carboxylesterase
MKSKDLSFLSLIMIFLFFSYANAKNIELAGTWKGTLKISGQELRILFKISQNEDHQFSAKMDSPDQGAKDIPVSDVLLNEEEILLNVKSIGGVYKGILQDDNQNILGTWKQSGYEFPLNLKKTAIAPVINSPQKLEKPQNVDSDIILETTKGSLFGTLVIPNIEPPFSVGLIIAGSGPTDRDGNNPKMVNNSLKMLATELSRNGIATLRYDKRGIGKSKSAGLKESDLRFENYIKDAGAWIDLLKQDSRFKDIIVIGHSEGSLIGMIASQQKNVTKFISIAGVGQSADKTIREQLKSQPSSVLEQSSPILDNLVQGKTVENIPPMLNALFRPSVQPYMISWFKYDPQKEISKLEKPVLIIQGTTDIQVTIDDAEKLAKANPKAKKQIIEGMNHIMKESEQDRQKNIQTYNQPVLPIKKELIKVIVDFIN